MKAEDENMATYTVKEGSEYMKCNVFGEVWRPSIGLNTPSGNWRITGAVRFNNFGYVVERYTLKEVLTQKLQWHYKNGNQRIYVCDLDYGTHRVWMNPKHEIYKD